MKMRTAKAASTAEKPIEVTISITRFKDVLAKRESRNGRSTEFTMRLGRKHPRAVIEGDNIIVRPPGDAIHFTITSSARDKDTYFPVGITFVREGARSSSAAERLGLLNFLQNQLRISGPSLAIVDSYKDKKKHIRYKFSVVIQRGSDGKIGIIDPGIVHEGDE